MLISVRAYATRLADLRAFAPSALMAISYSETMRAFGALPYPELTSDAEYMLKPWAVQRQQEVPRSQGPGYLLVHVEAI